MPTDIYTGEASVICKGGQQERENLCVWLKKSKSKRSINMKWVIWEVLLLLDPMKDSGCLWLSLNGPPKLHPISSRRMQIDWQDGFDLWVFTTIALVLEGVPMATLVAPITECLHKVPIYSPSSPLQTNTASALLSDNVAKRQEREL